MSKCVVHYNQLLINSFSTFLSNCSMYSFNFLPTILAIYLSLYLFSFDNRRPHRQNYVSIRRNRLSPSINGLSVPASKSLSISRAHPPLAHTPFLRHTPSRNPYQWRSYGARSSRCQPALSRLYPLDMRVSIRQ